MIVIKVGYKSYLVNITDAGKVDVHRKLGFFGKLFIRNSHTATSIRFENKISELISKNEFVAVKNSKDQLSNIIRNSGDKKVVEVANYGMHENRVNLVKSGVVEDLNQKTPGKDIALNTIDEYNKRLDIIPVKLKASQYLRTMRHIASGNIIPKGDPNSNYTDQKLTKWRDFLSKHADKINIPKKIFSYMNQKPGEADGNQKTTGWKAAFRNDPDQALKQFVTKNISRGVSQSVNGINDAEIEFIAGKLKKFVEISVEETKTQEQRQKVSNDFHDFYRVDDKWKLEGSDKTPEVLKNIFDNVLAYSTFRQTSKLGIDFFREQKVPVLFQFSDNKGRSLAGEGKNKIINEDFWKTSKHEGEKPITGSSITNSELRHVNKILQNQNLDEKTSSQAGIYLASGGLQV
jgi:hypothetical protein